MRKMKREVAIKESPASPRIAALKRMLGIAQLITAKLEEIEAGEQIVQEYCNAHRAELFQDKKSRATSLAEFGYEFTPHRVETSSRKITWKDVVKRLIRLPWGKAYLTTPDPKPDKIALLQDREKFTEEHKKAAGIEFCQDEQFYIRPRLETAAETVVKPAN